METKTVLAAQEAGRPPLGPPGWPVQLVDPPQNLERARPPLAGLVRCPAMSARTIEDRQPLSACFPYRFSRARHLAGHRARSPIEPPIRLQRRVFRAYRRGVFDVRLRTLLGSPPGKASYAQYLTLLRNPSATESGPGFSTPSGSVRGECSRRGRCGGDVTPGTRPPADRRPSPCPASVRGDRCDAPALPCYRERSALTVLPPSAGCVTAVARARRLTMGQPKPPVAPVRSGVRVWGASGL